MMKIGKKMILLVAVVLVTVFYSFDDVGLISGEVHTDGNLIHWEVKSSEKTDFFIVERSSNGINFIPLAMVSSQIDFSEYTFVDKQSNNNNWFYRVVNVDYDGVGDFSSAIYLENAFVSSGLESVKPPVNITIK